MKSVNMYGTSFISKTYAIASLVLELLVDGK